MSLRVIPELMLTVHETAQALKFGLTKTRELIRDGVIPSVKVDGLRRIRVTDLEEYVNGLKVDTPKTR
jgi:excisionase family DNA binding protein